MRILWTIVTAALCTSMSVAAEASFTEAQKQEIQNIVHQYLVQNPTVLMEASQALQKQTQDKMATQAKTAIVKEAALIFVDPLTVVGNPKGKVTLVEFFDYQCIHCKKMAPTLENLVAKNKDLRVIYKEFPIFGKSSEVASRAALAAAMQGKYLALHDALIKDDKHLSDKSVMDLAQKAGLNMEQLKKDMNGKTVTDQLAATRQLAEKLYLMGTPAIIIAATPDGQWKAGAEPTFLPGAASEETLQAIIQKAGA
ncbi:MAG: DsbA family protein [Legionellaceae bacterium]|nr:DsbA family protein [Legionellaceae bacterium]